MPLNELLVEWREQYGIQFSFNDKELAKYTITINERFNTPDEALKKLLNGLPLNFEYNAGVYIIYPDKKEKQAKNYLLIGKIIEAGTGEPLPFSHVSANNQQAVSDVKGMFSFQFKNDSIYQVKASHLGCYLLDTVLVAGTTHTLTLTPSMVGIKEVVVTNNIVEKSTQIGESPGLTSLNHHIANYLPGNGDNSVFNLLRLQPGILAAGEQPNDLIIWGSPEGTSRVTFDGFTIWGLKNFNDNISAVNPFLAKNIEIEKGGYGVTNDDVTGGIVKIAGKTGNTQQAGINLFINNQTLNGMLELPVNQKSAIMLAFRHTYYNLFNADDLPSNPSDQNVNMRVDAVPDYQFKDFNLKYSLQGNNGDLFFVSAFHGADEFKAQWNQETEKSYWQQNSQEDNKQLGASVFYGKTWLNGNQSTIKFSYSALQTDYSLQRQIERKKNKLVWLRRDEQAQNDVGELSFKWSNNFLVGEKHTLTLGSEYINNEVKLTEDTFNYRYIDLSERANRISLFAQDRWQITKRLAMTAGLRYNHSFFINKLYLDPRLSLSQKLGAHIKLNASWGLYHQFLVKSSIEDENGNFRYSWTLADNDEIPVMESQHLVLGAAYTRRNFLFSIDVFNKQNDGLTRYVRYRQSSYIFTGDSHSYGIDFYAKKDFKGHSIWSSYSLSKTEEYFPFFPDDEYRRSSQDQRHELKLAGLFNLGRFHLSSSYVYGSGFPLFSDYINQEYTEKDYNRLDASIVYKLSSRKFSGEVGLSVLNVTNTDNIKYNQFNRVPLDQINSVYINSEAVPFTPLLYLKVQF